MTLRLTHMCKPCRKSRAQEKCRIRQSWNNTDNPNFLLYSLKTALIQLMLLWTVCRFQGQLIKRKVCRCQYYFCAAFSCALLFLRGLHIRVKVTNGRWIPNLDGKGKKPTWRKICQNSKQILDVPIDRINYILSRFVIEARDTFDDLYKSANLYMISFLHWTEF